MKTNCSCGDTIIVGDKSKADYDAIRQKMRRALEGRDELFVQFAEPHYLKIRQFIVCEQLIPPPPVQRIIKCGASMASPLVY